MADLNQQLDEFCEEYYRRKPSEPPKTEVEVIAEEFIDNLIKQRRKPCDETSEAFNEQFRLPPYYDEKLFKNGQAFFRKHFIAMIFGKILGLTLILAAPGGAVIDMTKKSSTPIASFKRYVATVMHMMTWYEGDITPGSKLWKSLRAVRSMHNSVSKRSTVKFKYPINQVEMSGTLFAFMGFPVIRGEKVGIYNVTKDELKAFIHFWRVIGYMVGIDDRFSLCRASVDETIAINTMILERVFKQLMEKPYENFQVLSSALYDGLRNIFPWSNADIYIHFIHMLIENTDRVDMKKQCLKPLTPSQKSTLLNTIYYMSWFKSEVFRIITNYFMLLLFKAIPIFLRLKGIKVKFAELVK